MAIPRICVICSAPFTVTARRLSLRPCLYCSYQCRSIGVAQRMAQQPLQPCPKCGLVKPLEERCGGSPRRQCLACKAAHDHAYMLTHTITTRRNAPRGASIITRLLYYTTIPEDPNACWLWHGPKDAPDGYGVLTIKKRQYKAHRLMWEEKRGPIPEGLEVLHDCPGGDNKACNNPGHLWLGTDSDNLFDAWRKGQNRGPTRLPEATITAIRALHGTMTQTAIARMFHIHPSHVSRIVRQQARILSDAGSIMLPA